MSAERKFASDGCSAEFEYLGKRHAGHLEAGGAGMGSGMGAEDAEAKWFRMSQVGRGLLVAVSDACWLRTNDK